MPTEAATRRLGYVMGKQAQKTRQKAKARAFSKMKKYRSRVRKPLAIKTHNFVENLPAVDIDVKADTADGNIYDYHIAQITDWANYKGIFKLYRINKIVVTFKKDITGANVYNNNISANNMPYALQNVEVSYLRDYTKTTAESNLAEFKRNSKVKQIILSNDRPSATITLTPAVNKVTTYQDDVETTINKAQPVFKEWLDVSYDELLHRGLEVHCNAQNFTSRGKIRMDTKIYFSCRNLD